MLKNKNKTNKQKTKQNKQTNKQIKQTKTCKNNIIKQQMKNNNQ